MPATGLRYGAMRERLMLQRATEVIATSGQSLPTWANVCYFRAAVDTPSTGQLERGGAQASNAQFAIITHARQIRAEGVESLRHRLIWGTRTLQILHVGLSGESFLATILASAVEGEA